MYHEEPRFKYRGLDLTERDKLYVVCVLHINIQYALCTDLRYENIIADVEHNS